MKPTALQAADSPSQPTATSPSPLLPPFPLHNPSRPLLERLQRWKRVFGPRLVLLLLPDGSVKMYAPSGKASAYAGVTANETITARPHPRSRSPPRRIHGGVRAGRLGRAGRELTVADVMREHPGYSVGSLSSKRAELPPHKVLHPGGTYYLSKPSLAGERGRNGGSRQGGVPGESGQSVRAGDGSAGQGKKSGVLSPVESVGESEAPASAAGSGRSNAAGRDTAGGEEKVGMGSHMEFELCEEGEGEEGLLVDIIGECVDTEPPLIKGADGSATGAAGNGKYHQHQHQHQQQQQQHQQQQRRGLHMVKGILTLDINSDASDDEEGETDEYPDFDSTKESKKMKFEAESDAVCVEVESDTESDADSFATVSCTGGSCVTTPRSRSEASRKPPTGGRPPRFERHATVYPASSESSHSSQSTQSTRPHGRRQSMSAQNTPRGAALSRWQREESPRSPHEWQGVGRASRHGSAMSLQSQEQSPSGGGKRLNRTQGSRTHESSPRLPPSDWPRGHGDGEGSGNGNNGNNGSNGSSNTKHPGHPSQTCQFEQGKSGGLRRQESSEKSRLASALQQLWRQGSGGWGAGWHTAAAAAASSPGAAAAASADAGGFDDASPGSATKALAASLGDSGFAANTAPAVGGWSASTTPGAAIAFGGDHKRMASSLSLQGLSIEEEARGNRNGTGRDGTEHSELGSATIHSWKLPRSHTVGSRCLLPKSDGSGIDLRAQYSGAGVPASGASGVSGVQQSQGVPYTGGVPFTGGSRYAVSRSAGHGADLRARYMELEQRHGRPAHLDCRPEQQQRQQRQQQDHYQQHQQEQQQQHQQQRQHQAFHSQTPHSAWWHSMGGGGGGGGGGVQVDQTTRSQQELLPWHLPPQARSFQSRPVQSRGAASSLERTHSVPSEAILRSALFPTSLSCHSEEPSRGTINGGKSNGGMSNGGMVYGTSSGSSYSAAASPASLFFPRSPSVWTDTTSDSPAPALQLSYSLPYNAIPYSAIPYSATPYSAAPLQRGGSTVTGAKGPQKEMKSVTEGEDFWLSYHLQGVAGETANSLVKEQDQKFGEKESNVRGGGLTMHPMGGFDRLDLNHMQRWSQGMFVDEESPPPGPFRTLSWSELARQLQECQANANGSRLSPGDVLRMVVARQEVKGKV